MDAFTYRAGVLSAEEVPLDRLAAEVGTPFYCYSQGAIEARYRAFADALADLPATICYALKANGNLAVVRALAQAGAGADVVSEGELRRALAAGVPPQKIVFAGVGKTAAEMAFALEAGILQFNIESRPELEALSAVAVAAGKQAPVALRLNPDVDARTHRKITTGMAENKFGIDMEHAWEACRRAAELPGIALEGLAIHIGSQLTDLAPYTHAFAKLAGLYRELVGAGFPLRRLDLGGGLGIRYHKESELEFAAYAEVVRQAAGTLGAELIFEPGRSLVGNAGLLVARVVYVKEGAARRFVILDAAMNDLLRPALYDAWHDILPVAQPAETAPRQPFDVVGPICETTDTFAAQRLLPPIEAGDLVAFASAGAYGAVMSSSYNARLAVPEVLVSGTRHAVVHDRGDYQTLLAQDHIPYWLTER